MTASLHVKAQILLLRASQLQIAQRLRTYWSYQAVTAAHLHGTCARRCDLQVNTQQEESDNEQSYGTSARTDCEHHAGSSHFDTCRI